MDRTSLNPLILGLAVIAVIAASLLFWNNRTLSSDLATMKAARASVEREAKAASERANVAERSIEEVKSEMAKVQAANEAVNHSVTQLRNQLEQVQIQANSARSDFEARLKTTSDDLGKAQGDLARVTDELARERTTKDEAIRAANESNSRLQAELQQARDEAAREKAAREAANAATGSAGSSTGTPPQANP